MNDKPTRGPSASTPARRAQILRAALESFAERGYERASLRDIAARAGITHPALLHHFASKEELFAAAIEQHEQDERRVAAQAQQDGDDRAGTLGRLLEYGRLDPPFARAWLQLGVAASAPKHPAHAYFADRQARLLAEVAGRVKEGSAESSADPDTVATLLVALLRGLQVLHLTDPDLNTASALRQFVDLLLPAAPGRSSPGEPPRSAT